VRIVVVGATGTIGRAVAAALEGRHEVVRVGHSRGDRQVDIESADSIERLYREVGRFDALVCAAGRGAFGPLEQLGEDDFLLGLRSKLMGQVNLVRLGLEHVADGGSFTLTSGVLASEPSPGSAALTPTNAAVEGFARAAALELPRGVRVNVVSPPWVSETLEAMGRDGSAGLPASTVARAYVESVEGTRSGETLDARAFA
jgi:NAD(P)-dependent dehydrogenase (short-subunit alcohol dehydrogenase family)